MPSLLVWDRQPRQAESQLVTVAFDLTHIRAICNLDVSDLADPTLSTRITLERPDGLLLVSSLWHGGYRTRDGLSFHAPNVGVRWWVNDLPFAGIRAGGAVLVHVETSRMVSIDVTLEF